MSLHGGTRMDSRQAARAILFDRRMLIVCLWLALMSLPVWAAAVATEYWYVAECEDDFPALDTGIPDVTDGSLLKGHVGLWRTCKTVVSNITSAPGEAYVITACRRHHISSVATLSAEHKYNIMIGYTRTCLGFVVISALMLVLTIFFSVYTLRVPRYTLKRFTGCLFFITGSVQLVVIQMEEAFVSFLYQGPKFVFPDGCKVSYGYSFILSWVCVIVIFCCGLGFLMTSGKKKKRVHAGLDQDHAEDDEKHILGR